MRPRHKTHDVRRRPFRTQPRPACCIVGNMRAALFNWLFARRQQGKFILRLDDTDRARSKPEFEAAIERDLALAGTRVGREGTSVRSPRRITTRRAIALIASGRLYPCYETLEELRAQAPPPARPGTSAGLRPRRALARRCSTPASSRPRGCTPHWRFKLDGRARCTGTTWCAGPSMSTRRARAIRCWCAPTARTSTASPRWSTTSTSPSRHVIRGEDHVTNTGRADPDGRGAAVAACADFRPLAAADRRGGRWLEQAHRLAVGRRAARARHRRCMPLGATRRPLSSWWRR